MKTKTIRVLSMILCVLMLLGVFAGCGGTEDPTEEPTVEETQPAGPKPAFVNFRGDNLSVTDGTTPLTTGAQVEVGKVITVTYDNRAVADKVVTVKLNKEAWFVAQPGELSSKTFTTEENVMYTITVDLAVLQLKLTVGDGVTVVNKADGEELTTGEVPYGTEVSVTVQSDDKVKISKLAVNGETTDVMVVNAERTVDYTVTEDIAFTLDGSDYPITFAACNAADADVVNSKNQGIDLESGNLVGPNINKYSQTGFVTLPQDAVFTTTLKLNRGYSFGINMYISKDLSLDFGAEGLKYYRVSARPWFKIDGVGDFHGEYIQLNNNGAANNIELADPVVNDEVTIRLILDHTNNKVYLFVNNEEFTDRALIPITAEDFVRINFYYLCEADQEAGAYKTWSIRSGADAVEEALAESRPATFVFENSKLTVKDGEKTVENNGTVNAGKTVTVAYDNSAENEKSAIIKMNGTELFRVLPNQKGSEPVVAQAHETCNLTVEFADAEKVTVHVGSGMTVLKKSDNTPVADGAQVPAGTILLVTVSSDDKLKIMSLFANNQDTMLKTVNATQAFEYAVTEETTFEVKEEAYPVYFNACNEADVSNVSARYQGINPISGDLWTPNVNKYWQSDMIELNQNTVYTATLKLNRGYTFGLNMYLSEDPELDWGGVGLKYYRVSARPWFKVNNVGDFHAEYIQTNTNGAVQNIALKEAPADDTVTIRLIFDHDAGIVYVFVNGQEFTQYMNADYAENDHIRLNFYGLCELDAETPGFFKTWSVKSGADAVAEALAEMNVGTVTYPADEKLSVKDGDAVVTSGSAVASGKALTVSYNNTAEQVKTAKISVNGTLLFEAAPGQSGSGTVQVPVGACAITVELASPQVTLTYEAGMTVTDAAGQTIASGSSLENGTVVKVTLKSTDKQKIETLYANDAATRFFVVNAEEIVSYTVTADAALSIVESAYPVSFAACEAVNDSLVNARTSGIDVDGNLVGPNINKYSQTQFVTLNQDSVVTFTVKMNRAYTFGLNLYISESLLTEWGETGLKYYRVSARPWFKNNAGVGGFHGEYVQFNNNGAVNNIALANGAPVNDEVTFKLIFDHTNGKVYVYANGEDFTDRAAVPVTAKDEIRMNFYFMCEADQTAGYYKDWSIQTGADAVAAALAN